MPVLIFSALKMKEGKTMTIVAAKKCHSYQVDELSAELDSLLQELGGLENFVSAGDQVVFKINLLMGKAPEAAVTTNPEFIRVLARKVKALGADVIIADSPGGPFNEKLLKRAYKKSGLYQLAGEEDLELNYNTDSKKHEYKEGKINKSFQLASYLDKADLVINLPKLKTHGLTMYTGAVKNLFGCIPGILKAEYHLRMQSVYDFSRMLNDLAGLIAPQLTIMDAVVGMGGEGPSNGKPREFNYLLASTSPYYLDLAAVRLMEISPEKKVPSIKAALNDEIIKKEKLELRGNRIEPLDNVKIPKIEKENNLLGSKLPNFLSDILEKFLRPKPIFKEDKCAGCRTCFENCPPDAITMVDDFPEVDLDQCIRCFCCQELCSYEAVEIKYPLLAKLFFSN